METPLAIDPDDITEPGIPEAILDPPALERLAASPDSVVPPDTALKNYVLNEEAAPDVMRDLPFGAQPAFAGETPFFTSQDSTAQVWDSEDTDGIPTGLPDLLNLPDLRDPKTPAPVPKAVPEIRTVVDTRAVAEATRFGYQLAAGAFIAGAAITCLAFVIFLQTQV